MLTQYIVNDIITMNLVNFSYRHLLYILNLQIEIGCQYGPISFHCKKGRLHKDR
jgi:hypothetical protein